MEIDQKASDTTENRRAFLNDEVYYKDIVEGQTELICRFNSDNHLTFVNNIYCNYFHLKRKDIIGQSFMDVIHEEDREVFQALLSSLDRKNPVATAENRVTLPNRDVLWQQWTIWAIFDDKGMIVEYQAVGRDVTERMLTEADLKDSENNFRALAENANDGIILIGAEGNVLFANRCFAETSGYNLDELLTFGFEKLTDPSEREILEDRLRRRLKGENVSQNYETILITKSGRAVPIEVNGAKTIWQGDPAGLIIVRDITLRKEMGKSLRISQQNFREMAENVNDGILLTAGDGINVYANKGFTRISGYTVSELLNMGFKDLVPANERRKIIKRYFNRIAGKKVPNHYETKIVRKDGKIVPIEVSASKTVWQNQTAVLGIYRDISERIKREEEQEKVHDELERLVDQRTSELVAAAEEKELKHNELLLSRSELEKVNRELLDTNKALVALARNIDREREDAENKIAKMVRSRMLPLLEDFQKKATFKRYRAEIDELMLCVNELTPGLKKGSDIILSLSAMEIRIATMIKNGLISPDIADLLHISLDTVKSHRRNIRKKLKLNNLRINLASYLEAKM